MTDASQAVAWDRQQDPFGETTGTAGSGTTVLRFPGQRYDRASGLNYNYFRDYDPTLGRYIEADPIGLMGGINLYGYVGGNPIRYTDPSGLMTYQCKKPLDGLTEALGSSAGEFAYQHVPYLFHQYSCIVRDGQVTCGGQDRMGSNPFISSPGKPSNDVYKPEGCQQTRPDDDCFEKCLAGEWAKPRPRYGIPRGTDCQEYDDDVNQKCANQCKIKK